MCQTDTSAEKLRRLFLEPEDGYLAVQLIGLNINQIRAKEFMYHDTCYKTATRPIREEQPESSIVYWGYQDNFKPVYFFDEKISHAQKHVTSKNQLAKQK